MPQLNAFDAAPGRTVLTAGDLFEEAINVDLLVISAWENYYEGEPGSMVAVLRDRCGLEVKQFETLRHWIYGLLPRFGPGLPRQQQSWPSHRAGQKDL